MLSIAHIINLVNVDDSSNLFNAQPIKSEKGVAITNHNMHDQFIQKVHKGTEPVVDCHFRCLIYPGIYDTNASVGSRKKKEKVVLHQIFDSLVFKVQVEQGIKKSSGLVYYDQFFDIKKIKPGKSDDNRNRY